MLGNVIKSRENDDVTKLNRGEAGGPVSCCSLGCGSNVDRLGLRGSPPRGYVQLYAAALTSGEGFQPEEDRKGLSCSLLLFLEPHPPGFSLSAASFLLIFLRFAPGVFPAIPSPSWHCPSLVTLYFPCHPVISLHQTVNSLGSGTTSSCLWFPRVDHDCLVVE